VEKVDVGKRTESLQKVVKEETASSPHMPSDDQIQESLRIMNEETLQLSEFLLQEGKLVKELCILLKQVLKRLNMSFNIPSNVFPKVQSTQQIILNEEAHLIFISNENKVKSKALEDFPPQVILNVTSFIIPKLSNSLTSYRKRISSRLGLFNKINQELKNLSNTFANYPKNFENTRPPIDNGIKKALLTKQKGSNGEYKRKEGV